MIAANLLASWACRARLVAEDDRAVEIVRSARPSPRVMMRAAEKQAVVLAGPGPEAGLRAAALRLETGGEILAEKCQRMRRILRGCGIRPGVPGNGGRAQGHPDGFRCRCGRLS